MTASVTNGGNFSYVQYFSDIGYRNDLFSRISKLMSKVVDLSLYLHLTDMMNLSEWMIPLNEAKTMLSKAIDFTTFANLWHQLCKCIDLLIKTNTGDDEETEGADESLSGSIASQSSAESVDLYGINKIAIHDHLLSNLIKELIILISDLSKICLILDKTQTWILTASQKLFCQYIIPIIKILMSLTQLIMAIPVMESIIKECLPKQLERESLYQNAPGGSTPCLLTLGGQEITIVNHAQLEELNYGLKMLCIKQIPRLVTGILSLTILLINSYNFLIALGLFVALNEIGSFIQYLFELYYHSVITGLDPICQNFFKTF
jgi:hypothetical protein